MYAIEGARGLTRVKLDAYGIPHDTGVLNRDSTLEVKEVSMWSTKSGSRVRGPSEAVFPKMEGWVLDGQKTKLNALKVSRVTAALTLRKFVPPASEAAWNERRGTELTEVEGLLEAYFLFRDPARPGHMAQVSTPHAVHSGSPYGRG